MNSYRGDVLELVSQWIPVDSYLDIPVGIWLVKTEEDGVANPYQIIEMRKNIGVIGHHFAFDENRVMAYRPLGELYEGS